MCSLCDVQWCGEAAHRTQDACRQARRRSTRPSQRSLHNAPIFRLLLKVAVKGTHQCDFFNFCGASGPNNVKRVAPRLIHTAARLG